MSEKEINSINSKLEDLENRTKKLEDLLIREHEIFSISLKTAKYLADKIGVDISRLKEIYHIEDQNLVLLTYTEEENQDIKKKNQVITLLFLIGQRYILKKDFVSPSLVKKAIEIHGVSTKNFSHHMKEIIPHLIIRKGKSQHDYLYELTFPGEKKAINIIKMLLEIE